MNFEGYETTGKRTYVSARIFVQQSAAEPTVWLRFREMKDGTGYSVTGYKTKEKAIAGSSDV